MLRALSHNIPSLSQKSKVDLMVEQVAHATNENHLRLAPVQRLIEPVRMQGDLEGIILRVTVPSPESLCHPAGVTILAASRDGGASCNWVP